MIGTIKVDITFLDLFGSQVGNISPQKLKEINSYGRGLNRKNKSNGKRMISFQKCESDLSSEKPP